MYPFDQSVNPAVRSHIDAQTAFMNELSQTVAHSFQQVIQLNMQLCQTLFDETTSTAQRMLNVDRPIDALSKASLGAQPATDKLRSYQQQLSELAASTQVDLSRVSEQHVQETSRTARTLADEVTRASVEETDKNLRQQDDAMKEVRASFVKEAERGARSGAQFLSELGGDLADAKPDGQAVPARTSGDTGDGYRQPGARTAPPAR